MDITFQKIQIQDLNLVLELFKTAAEKIAKKNVDHWQYWKNPPEEKIKWVKNGIENDEFYFINDLNNYNIGMVRILSKDELYWGKQNIKAKYVHSLVIKGEFNGKGIGKIVLDEVEKNAKENGCVYVRLDAVAKNTKLCEYYENLGFIKVGIKEMPQSINNLYQKKIL
ncbi:GNAT family N-acetyltransferase [Tenacibaculum sp. 190524A05c]|uniref:GNAT family N-acetyltransferase n=1 Tax=Tenacibaculum platacis TaxID=3137852 RepID=A0ABM9P3S0_9FLAO